MKTFLEACCVFQSTAKLSEILDNRISPEAQRELDAINSRFSEIIKEMAKSKAVTALIHSLMVQVGSKRIEPTEALYNAFAYGLMVGIEMEKSE